MGSAATDGRLIRPCDDPTTAKLDFDWCQIHNEALARQVNLRRQKWQIKKVEMELIAARNFLLPRLDGVARYRWLGLGDRPDRSNNGMGIDPGRDVHRRDRCLQHAHRRPLPGMGPGTAAQHADRFPPRAGRSAARSVAAGTRAGRAAGPGAGSLPPAHRSHPQSAQQPRDRRDAVQPGHRGPQRSERRPGDL